MKKLDEFYLTYDLKPSVRCKDCCDIISKEIQDRIERRMTYFPSSTGRTIGVYNEDDRVKDFLKEKKDRKKLKMKTYDDYVDEDVERGNITKSDGAYYKAQKKNTTLKGAGMFHGRIINKK